jgi:hypothetical protein
MVRVQGRVNFSFIQGMASLMVIAAVVLVLASCGAGFHKGYSRPER